MNRMHPRELRLLIITLVVGVLAVGQIMVVRPLVGKISRLRVKAKASAQALADMQATVARRPAVEGAYETIRNRILSNRTPGDEIIDMLVTVDEAARKAGVEVLWNSHDKDEPFEYFDLHTVRFRGQGSLENMIRMIDALQDPQLLFKIPEMSFSMKNHQLMRELSITRVVSGVKQDG